MYSHCAESLVKQNYLDFNSVNLKDKSYIIGNKYSDINFSSKGIAKDQIGNCTTFSDFNNNISYTLNNQKLVEVLVGSENKSIYTSKNIRNGMVVENIYKNYKDYKIKKIKSEGAGDSQDDYTFIVTDNLQKNNSLIFDVVHGEIQGIHLGKKGFDLSDCE
ncbi:hypothetical protein MKL42_16435 [Acinetobacter sp. AOR15_HL]|uniref:hypothetical protein n=1 Tax=unclassified Acinetobacter TaxID=196816 RepID=UPI0022EB3F63|nr:MULTISPECIES: hypothetical protein [unclassified Acinetobacter]MDA3559072.1 hypothetical protein [Acinetobacter sp. AOR15_HL]MDA3572337.1 hypothetical protein [Acinetobacter sp. AOR14_HL]